MPAEKDISNADKPFKAAVANTPAGVSPAIPGLAEALRFVLLGFGKTVSTDELLSGLPGSAEGLSLTQLDEVADRAGFKVDIRQCEVEDIPAITLPCLLVTENTGAVAVTALSEDRQSLKVFDPDSGQADLWITKDRLEGVKAPVAVFLAPRSESTEDTGTSGPEKHWFWSAVRRMWPNYLQVVIAALFGNLLALASPLFIMNVYDRVIPNLAISTLWVLTAGVVLAFGFDFLLKLLRMYIVDETGRRVDMAVAGRVFDQILQVRLASQRGPTGATANQVRDLDMVRDAMTSSSVIALTDFLFIGIFVWVMIVLVGPLAYVPAMAVPLVLVVTTLVQFPLARTLKASQQDIARRQAVLVDTLVSLETVKTSGAESWLRGMWDRAVAAASRSTARARSWANLATSFTALVNQAVSIVIVVWGVFLVIDGSISIGALIAANILAARILAPLANIAQTLARLHHARTAYRGLDALMGLDRERKGTTRTLPETTAGDIICLKGVTFQYPGAASPSLIDLNLSIRPGERIGIIGRVGSGKSTLTRLLAGLYQPDQGSYLVKGIDTNQVSTAELRSKIGLCLQDADLFSGTLRDNILMGQHLKAEDRLEAILRLSGVAHFADQHPLGLGMPISERGQSLSGGQKQAVAIARCLMREPDVLVLDEPTANMDLGAERKLCSALKEIADTGHTLIVATHRDGPLEILDRLVLLEAGRIIMDGPKNEVIARLRKGAGQTETGGAS